MYPSNAASMPAAEVDIDDALVRRLLVSQCPQWASLPLRPLANGWDNVIYRLGDELSVRLPRRELAVFTAKHEQRALPELAARLPLPVPVPLHAGHPDPGYPWPWSVCRWVPGEAALFSAVDDLADTARTLGAFIAALHQPAPEDAPHNPYRGGPLAERAPFASERIELLASEIDGSRARALLEDALDAPVHTGPPIWVHGDLHPGNLLVVNGRLSGVIDFGDVSGGDPATDFFVAWMLFPPELRPAFTMAAGGIDDAGWRRARGWALVMALALLAGSADNPPYAALGRRTLEAVLNDPIGRA